MSAPTSPETSQPETGTDPIRIYRADAAAADWRAVLDLILDAFAYMDGRIDPPSSAHRLTPEAIRDQAATGTVLLADGGGEGLLGCVFLTPKPDCLYLGKLAVRPGLQGRGIGRRLMATAFDAARADGHAAIELQARVELEENHRIFAGMGFVETGRTAHDGYDRPTSVTMRCAL